MKVLIVGGTSGLGQALARHYLAAGATVGIAGRDPGRSELPAQSALQRFALDIADRNALAAAIDAFAPLDLLIVTAGIYYNTRHEALDAAATLALLRTNVSGLAHALELAAAKLLGQGSGQIVAVASIAGLLHDYPGASLYSATKRSVINLCDTYATALAPFGIGVTAIVPGYIDTAKLRALNGGDASGKRFIVSEDEAVAQVLDAIARRERRRVFPWQMRWAVRALNRLPRALLRWRR